MHSNPMQMQMQQQGSPMQRPPHMSMGGPSIRPMVASSPMQVSMIQSSPQSSMMARPVGSPYGMVNRPMLYDKNKRSTYSSDLRPPPMGQPGQPLPMGYPPGMVANPSMMPNPHAPGAGPMRQ